MFSGRKKTSKFAHVVPPPLRADAATSTGPLQSSAAFKQLKLRVDAHPPDESQVPTTPKSRNDPVANDPAFGLQVSDRLFVVVLLVVILGLTSIRSFQGSALEERSVHQRGESTAYFLNVNAAESAEWSLLDGIGPKLAHEIVRDREENGPFESIDDLARVRGIGPVRVARMRPHLRIDDSAR